MKYKIFILIIFLVCFNVNLFSDQDLFSIKWDQKELKTLSLKINKQEDLFNTCLKSGLEYEYRFHFVVCEKKNGVNKNCLKQRVETNKLIFNQLKETYVLVNDRHKFGQLPKEVVFNSAASAFDALRSVNEIPLRYLLFKKKKYLKKNNLILKVQVLSDCHKKGGKVPGSFYRFLFSSFDSLSGFNTNWFEFDLNRENKKIKK